jgi:hypothetical protein
MAGSLSTRILDAMRSGEWLRTQWIARVVFGLGNGPWQPDAGAKTRHALRMLERRGLVELRASSERRSGEIAGVPVAFDIPRDEWRIVRSAGDPTDPPTTDA